MAFRVCFVCTGNICRSPSALFIATALAEQENVFDVDFDSSGTGNWHIGQDIDPRARDTLVARGYKPTSHRAKQWDPRQGSEYDLVLVAEQSHIDEIVSMARGNGYDLPKDLRLMSEFATRFSGDVLDPYYQGKDSFKKSFSQIEDCCNGLVNWLAER